MIKSMSVTNYLGESIEIPLGNPYETGFAITEIDGLGPGKSDISVTELTSRDGSIFNSSRVGTRNIVLTIRFIETPDIETVRQKTYKYFPIKKQVTLGFETDNRSCYINGYVESNEPDIFSDKESSQISIICPDPYFYSKDLNSTVFSGVISEFEFPFSNELPIDPVVFGKTTQNGTGDPSQTEENQIEYSSLELSTEKNVYYSGDSEVGITIKIQSIGTVEHLTIYNTKTREFLKIDTDKLESITGHPIIEGDELTICTVKGKKSITLLRDGETINILNTMTRDSSWLQLTKGDNLFAYAAETGSEMLYFTIESNILYEGI